MAEVAVSVIAAAWADELGADEIDVDTGFFDLGADSLTVVRVVGVLREHWPELTVVDVFANPTVTALASFVRSRERC